MVKRYLHSRAEQNTLSDTDAPTTNSGTLMGLIGGLANRIKAITGKGSWRDAPDVTLADAATHHGRADNPHSVTRGQLGAAAATALDSHAANQQNPHGVTAAQARARADTWVPGWSDVTGKPVSFPSTWAEVASKPTTYPSTWTQVASKPAVFPPETHTHDYAPSSHVGSGGSAHANAVSGGASGFMTGADKQKLAAIPGLDTTFRCEVTRLNNQSTNNNEFTTVIWESATVNPRNWWASSQPTRITPGAAGAYLVQLISQWQGSANGRRDQGVAVNGVRHPALNYADPRLNANASMSSAYIINLSSSTDYIELMGRQDSGGALSMLSTFTAIVVRIL